MTRILIVLFSLSILIACGDDGGAPTPPPPPNFSRDSGTSPEDDCTPESDEALCTLHEAECGELTVIDECGEERVVDCGDEAEICEGLDTCGGGEKANVCGCGGESDADLCELHEAECGGLSVTDSCGAERIIECGNEEEVCAAPETCGGGEKPNACGCTGEDALELCAAAGAECGEINVTDRCGKEREVNCGDEAIVCESPETCGGGKSANVCGCTVMDDRTDAELCTAAGAECGKLIFVDECGDERTLNCGNEEEVCVSPTSCGGGGTPNVCGCTALDTIAELCASIGAHCGPALATDSCGVERPIDCGDPEVICAAPETCGGGGTPNVCGCTPIAEDFCAQRGADCGLIDVVDSCLTPQSVDCGDEADVCEWYETCGAGGEENLCGCVATTCELSNYACGDFDSGCNTTLSCSNFCVESVHAGYEHACAIGSGTVRCWGNGQYGRLGIGSTPARERIPRKIDLDGAIDLGLGREHSCAVLSNGSVVCWGRNHRGQLGDGTTEDVHAPNLDKKAVHSGATFIAAGVEHSCALVSGAVSCWGSNTYGELGDNLLDYGSHSSLRRAVYELDADIVDLAVGSHHSCALKASGEVYCWGRNRYGQLGNLEAEDAAQLRDGSGAECGFETVPAFGVTHSGANALDLGTRVDDRRSRPVKVENLPSDIVAVAAGEAISCALDSSGDLYCWGALIRNYDSTVDACRGLGEKTPKNPSACAIWPPADLGDDPNVFPIARFSELCCGSGEEADCRESSIEQLYLNRAALRPILVASEVAAVEAGDNHVCFLKSDAPPNATNVFCIGANANGQVGDGTNNNWGVPQPTATVQQTGQPLDAMGLSLGGAFSCAASAEPSAIHCWGNNNQGQIGNDSFDLNKSTLSPYTVRIDYIP